MAENIQEDNQAVENQEDEFVNSMELGPAQQAQVDAYTDNATIVVFSEKTQPAILQGLQQDASAEFGLSAQEASQLSEEQKHVLSVAATAYQVHKQLEQKLSGTGEKMTEITMTLGAAHLVSELIVLAEAAGLYSLNDTDKKEAYRRAIMKYFEQGLHDGSIDPVELQKSIEPLMTPEQRKFGEANMNGISKTAPPSNQPSGAMMQGNPPSGVMTQGGNGAILQSGGQNGL